VVLGVAAATSTVAIGAAILVTRSISSPLRALQRSVRLMAPGDFTVRAPVEGPNELSEVAAAFNEMAARLGELFDARRELVAWASHDLRTPLTALQSTLEAVEDGIVEPGHYLPAMRQKF
jgi:signal transduction histidine kinase